MPKLLSRSKHEEFESNSALQIKDNKERREENTRKLEHLRNLVPASTIHNSATVHDAATVHLLFDTLMFLFQFFVSSKFVLVIAFGFSFFL